MVECLRESALLGWGLPVNEGAGGASFLMAVLSICVSFQLCLLLCNPMDWGLPGSSVHGIFQENTGVSSYSFLQGIFPAQGLNPFLLHCRQILYCLSHQGSPFEDRVLFNSCFPGSERSAGKGIGFPLQYSGLENSLDSIFGHDWATFISRPLQSNEYCNNASYMNFYFLVSI